jgi:hypothetical protein
MGISCPPLHSPARAVPHTPTHPPCVAHGRAQRLPRWLLVVLAVHRRMPRVCACVCVAGGTYWPCSFWCVWTYPGLYAKPTVWGATGGVYRRWCRLPGVLVLAVGGSEICLFGVGACAGGSHHTRVSGGRQCGLVHLWYASKRTRHAAGARWCCVVWYQYQQSWNRPAAA